MKIKLLKKKKEGKDIKSFIFEKPKGFNFKPGQFIYLTLPKLFFDDQRGNTRHFTIASSPTEEYLMITTRIRKESGYKRTLDKMQKGDLINYRGPFGDFILGKEKKETQVFLAGGIGITPFRNIIKYQIDKGYKTPMHLINSCSTTEEIAFRKELEGWEKEGKIKLDITITHPEESKEKWKKLTGRLDHKILKKLTKNYDLKNTIFWLCGPPPFVSAIEIEVEKLGIKERNIITEKFSGY